MNICPYLRGGGYVVSSEDLFILSLFQLLVSAFNLSFNSSRWHGNVWNRSQALRRNLLLLLCQFSKNLMNSVSFQDGGDFSQGNCCLQQWSKPCSLNNSLFKVTARKSHAEDVNRCCLYLQSGCAQHHEFVFVFSPLQASVVQQQPKLDQCPVFCSDE